jgi:uncharacterized protein (DUF1015 family)
VAARVAAVPYDVVTTDEARALAADPLSFLHVSRAEIDVPLGTSPHAPEVYARARANFDRLRAEAPLEREAEPCVYVYRLTMGGHTQTGVAGGFSVDEYERGAIKKHELTRVDKEDDRTRHIVALRAQTGPVFLTYRASTRVDEAVTALTATQPQTDFEAVDGVRHTVWKAPDAARVALVDAFGQVSSLYIADGHHRAASAARARRQVGSDDANAFLAAAFPDREMQVLPYNRLVADLWGRGAAAFRDALSAVAAVRPGGPVPRPGHVSMFLADAWWDVALPAATSARASDRLDVSRLQAHVLEPLLGIADPRTDSRIEFVGGARGTAALEARVRAGSAAIAFSLAPVTVSDLMQISDEGDIMPPKSTWFEPKLRDGLLSHLI